MLWKWKHRDYGIKKWDTGYGYRRYGEGSLGEDNAHVWSQCYLREEKQKEHYTVSPAEERVCEEVWDL